MCGEDERACLVLEGKKGGGQAGRENCKYRTSNVTLHSFAIFNVVFVKMCFETLTSCNYAIRRIFPLF
jgi:hypothetical protein